MKIVLQPVVVLQPDEEQALKVTGEIFEMVVALLQENRQEGFVPFQDGLTAPPAFWSICHCCHVIEDENLIP